MTAEEVTDTASTILLITNELERLYGNFVFAEPWSRGQIVVDTDTHSIHAEELGGSECGNSTTPNDWADFVTMGYRVVVCCTK